MQSPEAVPEVSVAPAPALPAVVHFVDVGPLVANFTAMIVGLYHEAGLEPPNPFMFTEAELQRLVNGIREKA